MKCCWCPCGSDWTNAKVKINYGIPFFLKQRDHNDSSDAGLLILHFPQIRKKWREKI